MAEFYRRKYAISPHSTEMGTPEIAPVLNRAMAFERFELWFGPHPETQLGLLQVLVEMAMSHPSLLARATLVSPAEDLGMARMEWTRAQTFPATQMDDPLVADARRAWSAWCSPTPEAWCALLDAPVALPLFAAVIPRLLRELPDSATGLSFSESRLLRIVANGARMPLDVFDSPDLLIGDPSYDYFTLGQMLLDMFHGPAPLLSGTTETTFDLALHEDITRHSAFVGSEIEITALGQDILNSQMDYLAIAPIDRWWGGTHLRPGNLWRWNSATNKLVPP
ncbi:MAG: hypothetical protein R3C46_03385 [Hyphomonadaceae bacterium]